MKKNNLLIVILLLSLFSCLPTIKAASLDGNTITNAGATQFCQLFQDDKNIKAMNGVYFVKGFAVYTYTSSSKKYLLGLIDTSSCKYVISTTSEKTGNGIDITFSSVSSAFYSIAGNGTMGIQVYKVNNSGLTNERGFNSTIQFQAFEHDLNSKFYIIGTDNNLYTFTSLNEKPTKKYGEIINTSHNGKKLIVEGMSLGLNNVYVATREADTGEAYVLVYNMENGSYKYAINVTGVTSSASDSALKGITVIDNSMYLGYNVTSRKTNEFYVINDLRKIENDYGSKIVNIELVSTGETTILSGQPFDFSNLSVRITHRSGAQEEIKLNASNTTVNGFNTTVVGNQHVTLSYAGYSFEYNVNVVGSITPVEGVTVNKKKVTVKIGTEEKVSASVTPKGATNKKVTWASADNNIATVNNGKITGVNIGTTTVTVTTVDGGKTATVEVEVVPEDAPVVTDVILDVKESITITKYGDFDYSNLYVKKIYSDGNEEEIKLTEENCTIENFNNEQSGVQTITIIFEDYTFETEVTVKELEERESNETKNIEPKTINVLATKEKSNAGIIILVILISLGSIGVLGFLLAKNFLPKNK